MEEIWKDVPGYEGLYQVSNLEGLRHPECWRNGKNGLYFRKERIIDTKNRVPNKAGYINVSLSKNNVKTMNYFHRIVWEAFNGPIPEGYQVNHINEDKTDNRLENLNLLTAKENINWGTAQERRKEKIRANKKAKRILQMDKEGNPIKEWETVKKAADSLGITARTIYFVLKGKQKGYPRYTAGGYKWKYL